MTYYIGATGLDKFIYLLNSSSNNLINQIISTSNNLIGYTNIKILNTSNYILTSSNNLIGYTNVNILNTSNYILTSSNNLIDYTNTKILNTSNYVLNTSNELIGVIKNTSNNLQQALDIASNLLSQDIQNVAGDVADIVADIGTVGVAGTIANNVNLLQSAVGIAALGGTAATGLFLAIDNLADTKTDKSLFNNGNVGIKNVGLEQSVWLLHDGNIFEDKEVGGISTNSYVSLKEPYLSLPTTVNNNNTNQSNYVLNTSNIISNRITSLNTYSSNYVLNTSNTISNRITSLRTNNIPESVNLYYTNDRVDTRINAFNIYTNATNVGIGTTNPTAKFEVKASYSVDTSNDRGFCLNANDNWSTFKLKLVPYVAAPNQVNYKYAIYNQNIISDNVLVLAYNGNIGIGSSLPSEKLDVVGNIKENGTNLINKYLQITDFNIKDTNSSNYVLNTSNSISNRITSLDTNSSNYVSNTSNSISNRISSLDTNSSNYVLNTSNSISNRITTLDTNSSNYVLNTSNSISNIITSLDTNSSNYVSNTSNLISNIITSLDTNSSNYVSNTSNIILNRITSLDGNSSNYTLNTSNIISNRITSLNTYSSNYVLSTSNIISNRITSLRTNNIPESVNLYYTNDRVDTRINAFNIYTNATNVGIGTPNPTAKFEIKASYSVDTSNDRGFCLNANDNWSTFKLKLVPYVAAANQVNYKYAIYNQNIISDNVLVLAYNGNIGIGSSLPSEKLDVVGNIKENGTNLINKYLQITDFNTKDTNSSNYVLNTSNSISNRITSLDTNSSNYVLNTSNIISNIITSLDTNSSNYVLNTSNIISNIITSLDTNSSNYVLNTSNSISNRITILDTNQSTNITSTSNSISNRITSLDTNTSNFISTKYLPLTGGTISPNLHVGSTFLPEYNFTVNDNIYCHSTEDKSLQVVHLGTTGNFKYGTIGTALANDVVSVSMGVQNNSTITNIRMSSADNIIRMNGVVHMGDSLITSNLIQRNSKFFYTVSSVNGYEKYIDITLIKSFTDTSRQFSMKYFTITFLRCKYTDYQNADNLNGRFKCDVFINKNDGNGNTSGTTTDNFFNYYQGFYNYNSGKPYLKIIDFNKILFVSADTVGEKWFYIIEDYLA